MTDYYEALDKQTFQLRAQYLMAKYVRRDYIESANLLYVRNQAAGEGRIDDMPKFKIKSKFCQDRCNAMSQAKSYCDEWESDVEAATTLLRDDNLAKLNRRL